MGNLLSMLTAATVFVGTAHAAPFVMTNDELDAIFAGEGAGATIAQSAVSNGSGNGNGNGNIGNNNGNNNQGNNNGNGNLGSGNGNGNATDNNGNGPRAKSRGAEDVLDVLHDLFTDIIAFDDGDRAADLRREVKLRVYQARLTKAKAEDDAAKVRKFERKIERIAAKHAEAAAAADRKRRNGITRKDLDFVFFSGNDAPNPKKGLQRIVDRGFVLYGHDTTRFSKFADRLWKVVRD